MVALQLDLKPGGEFRSARVAAEGVGATMVLGDRPIEVSLRRAWDALSFRRRAALLFGLARVRITVYHKYCHLALAHAPTPDTVEHLIMWRQTLLFNCTAPLDAHNHQCRTSLSGHLLLPMIELCCTFTSDWKAKLPAIVARGHRVCLLLDQ